MLYIIIFLFLTPSTPASVSSFYSSPFSSSRALVFISTIKEEAYILHIDEALPQSIKFSSYILHSQIYQVSMKVPPSLLKGINKPKTSLELLSLCIYNSEHSNLCNFAKLNFQKIFTNNVDPKSILKLPKSDTKNHYVTPQTVIIEVLNFNKQSKDKKFIQISGTANSKVEGTDLLLENNSYKILNFLTSNSEIFNLKSTFSRKRSIPFERLMEIAENAKNFKCEVFVLSSLTKNQISKIQLEGWKKFFIKKGTILERDEKSFEREFGAFLSDVSFKEEREIENPVLNKPLEDEEIEEEEDNPSEEIGEDDDEEEEEEISKKDIKNKIDKKEKEKENAKEANNNKNNIKEIERKENNRIHYWIFGSVGLVCVSLLIGGFIFMWVKKRNR